MILPSICLSWGGQCCLSLSSTLTTHGFIAVWKSQGGGLELPLWPEYRASGTWCWPLPELRVAFSCLFSVPLLHCTSQSIGWPCAACSLVLWADCFLVCSPCQWPSSILYIFCYCPALPTGTSPTWEVQSRHTLVGGPLVWEPPLTELLL